MALLKAGKNVSEDFYSGMNFFNTPDNLVVDKLISGAESIINSAVRYNFSDNYAILNPDVKLILNELASDIVGIHMVKYDMSTYTSRVEAEDIINVLRDSKLLGLSVLRSMKVKDFINAA